MTRAEDMAKLGLREIEVSIILTVPLALPQRHEDRLVGALGSVAADMDDVIEAGIRTLHIPADDLLFLHNEVRLAGELFRQIDPGEVFGAMTCAEATAAADIFRAAGDTDTAEHIIFSHGIRDQDPEDQHHDIYQEAQREQQQ